MRLYARFAAVLTALALAAVALVLSGAAQSRPAPTTIAAIEVGGLALGTPSTAR